VELATPDKPSEYRVGLQNFYVLTRYNRSALYATAVAELAAALKKTQ
jgi:membrane-bound lytic murein transglycosylase B